MWGNSSASHGPFFAAPDRDIEDVRWMRLALRQAMKAVGRVHPNPAVGCVIVRDGFVVGAGHTQPPPGPHAEVMALREVGGAARGATLYATLEPCNHHGRTPPCSQAILAAGVRRVVAAVRDPHATASGGLETLAAAGVETRVGVGAEQSEQLLTPFLHWARTGRPYVVLKAAMTLDGKTASATGASQWITGPVARGYVHRLRARLGGVMVGIGTALADDPLLTVRYAHSSLSPPSQPARIVVDSHLRLPLSSRLAQTAREMRTLVGCLDTAETARIAALSALGVEIVPVAGKAGRPDMALLMEELGGRGITGILLEGGGELAWSALETGVVDEVLYFMAPKLMGGRSAPSPLDGAGFSSPDAAMQVMDVTGRRCGVDWVFRGRVAHLDGLPPDRTASPTPS